MKKSTRIFAVLLFASAWALLLAIKFTPTEEQDVIRRINTDTTLINHSEIQVQELSETEMWYRMSEGRYLNKD